MDQIISSIEKHARPELLKTYKAHEIIYPASHPRYHKKNNYREAAVLVSIVDIDSQLNTILIKRTNRGAHANQMAFPGGAVEKQDLNLAETATREYFEEVGVNSMQVVAAMTPLYISVSNFMLYPYLGYSTHKNPSFRSQTSEVEDIIAIPLEYIKDMPLHETQVSAAGQNIQVKSFLYEEHIIWGATAMIMAEFQIICKKAF